VSLVQKHDKPMNRLIKVNVNYVIKNGNKTRTIAGKKLFLVRDDRGTRILAQVNNQSTVKVRTGTQTKTYARNRRISSLGGSSLATWKRRLITQAIDRTEGSVKEALSNLLHRPERRVLTKNY